MNESNERQSEGEQHAPEEQGSKAVEYGTGSEFYRFGRAVKDRFLEIAPKLWPNTGKMCRAVGITRQCYYYHIKHDPIFRQAMEEIRESRLDDLEEVNVKEGEGTGKEAFLPRISTLKAYRKPIYDPARVVRVEDVRMGQGEAGRRLGGLENAIDTEIVKSYSDRKQIREAKRSGSEERREGEAGGAEGGGK